MTTMTDRKALADRLDDYAAHADIADKGSEAVDLRDAAAALRADAGTVEREAVHKADQGVGRLDHMASNGRRVVEFEDRKMIVEACETIRAALRSPDPAPLATRANIDANDLWEEYLAETDTPSPQGAMAFAVDRLIRATEAGR